VTEVCVTSSEKFIKTGQSISTIFACETLLALFNTDGTQIKTYGRFRGAYYLHHQDDE
jgi:hypothetical protein